MKDRQKKPLHHKTGRECEEGTGRQAGLPQMAAEVPKECFSVQGIHPEMHGV